MPRRRSRRRLLCGNWKMNLDRAAARSLASSLRSSASALREHGHPEVVLFPPFPYLGVVGDVVRGSSLALGAQNLHQSRQGAFTGEVSAGMLVDMGCTHVIVGHSERRHGFGESDVLVAEKAEAAVSAGLTPVVCVGETGDERDANATFRVVERQLGAVIEALGSPEALSACVLAYEPVWAIGTGRVAMPEQAQAVHHRLRMVLGAAGESVPILYGGSLNGDNARDIFAQADVDGGLVGGASLTASGFLQLLSGLKDRD